MDTEFVAETVRRIECASNRDGAAHAYAQALLVVGQYDTEAWPIINKAALSRWTTSGLIYVKKKAWKIAEGRDDEEPE